MNIDVRQFLSIISHKSLDSVEKPENDDYHDDESENRLQRAEKEGEQAENLPDDFECQPDDDEDEHYFQQGIYFETASV